MQTLKASVEEYTPKLLPYAGYEKSESIGEKEYWYLRLWIHVYGCQDKELNLQLFSLSMK